MVLILPRSRKTLAVRPTLVAVNVAGLDDTVFADTLFGHVRVFRVQLDADVVSPMLLGNHMILATPHSLSGSNPDKRPFVIGLISFAAVEVPVVQAVVGNRLAIEVSLARDAIAESRDHISAVLDTRVGLIVPVLEAESQRVVAACQKHKVKLAVAHQTRYSPKLKFVRELIAAGKLGKVLEIRARGKEDARGGAEDLFVLGHVGEVVLGLVLEELRALRVHDADLAVVEVDAVLRVDGAHAVGHQLVGRREDEVDVLLVLQDDVVEHLHRGLGELDAGPRQAQDLLPLGVADALRHAARQAPREVGLVAAGTCPPTARR